MDRLTAEKFFTANEDPRKPHMLVSLPAVVETYDNQFYPVLCFFTDFDELDVPESCIIFKDNAVQILLDVDFKAFHRLPDVDERTVCTDIVCSDNGHAPGAIPSDIKDLIGWAWNELVERYYSGIDEDDQDEERRRLMKHFASIRKVEEVCKWMSAQNI